jgi:hypothetical protein
VQFGLEVSVISRSLSTTLPLAESRELSVGSYYRYVAVVTEQVELTGMLVVTFIDRLMKLIMTELCFLRTRCCYDKRSCTWNWNGEVRKLLHK